jgi:hypothetical protein
MRPLGGLLLAAAAVVSAPCAWAQSASAIADASSTPSAATALFRAAFAPAATDHTAPVYSLAPVGLRTDPDAAAATDGVFVLPAYAGASPGRLSASGRVVDGGLAVWSSGEVMLGASPAGVDSVRMTLGGVARAPGGVLPARPGNLLNPDAQAFDVRYIHGWPSALKWSAGGYDLDVSPHAALGLSNAGGTAEAGAMVRFGSDLGAKVARKLGLHEVDGATYGDRGRWYLFAAASGQAVGLNMTPGAPGLPRNSWSSESTSALISDAQAGVGWRKGAMQASFGYVHREIKSQSVDLTSGNPAKISDSMVAFSLSIHPH